MSWAKEKTNRALQSMHDVHRAYVELVPQALPFHNDPFKNWDAAIALAALYDTTVMQERVLDAGACRDPAYPSPFLPGAQRLGYQQLFGVNLDETKREFENGICYDYGDITKLGFPDKYFAYVTSLSTIEHGVDYRLFLAEMARILHSSGHLFVSFDYWIDPIDTGDRMMYGVPVKIFNSNDVLKMVNYANDVGFDLVRPMDLTCKDRVVTWYGLQYTFCNLLFQRR